MSFAHMPHAAEFCVVGGDDIGIAFTEMVSGTDNYLVFDDHGERLVALKLNYHAGEVVAIGKQ